MVENVGAVGRAEFRFHLQANGGARMVCKTQSALENAGSLAAFAANVRGDKRRNCWARLIVLCSCIVDAIVYLGGGSKLGVSEEAVFAGSIRVHETTISGG